MLNSLLKKSVAVFIVLLSLTSYLFSGEDTALISGFIIDKTNNKPLSNVNVYISGTVFGSTTNQFGHYKIDNIPDGRHELVASLIGYEIQIINISLHKDDPIKINFKLIPKIYDAETIIVSAAEQKKWFENLHLFKKLFLGTSSSVKNCIIKNEDVLEFTGDSQSHFYAKAKQPLKIINNFLGYEIHCELLSFKYDKALEKWSWIIKPWFIDLKPKDADELNLWITNRTETYKGSLHHFLFSMIYKRLDEEGFEICASKTSSDYFLKINPLNQYEILPDSLFKKDEQSNSFLLSFNDYLKVVYKNRIISRTVPKYKNMFYRTVKGYQTSWLKLNNSSVKVDEFGYPVEIYPFIKYGYWSKMGIANILPRYFKKGY